MKRSRRFNGCMEINAAIGNVVIDVVKITKGRRHDEDVTMYRALAAVKLLNGGHDRQRHLVQDFAARGVPLQFGDVTVSNCDPRDAPGCEGAGRYKDRTCWVWSRTTWSKDVQWLVDLGVLERVSRRRHVITPFGSFVAQFLLDSVDPRHKITTEK